MSVLMMLYRLALRLLPADMREAHGREMVEEARLQLEDARRAGAPAWVVATWRLGVDLAFAFAREWRATLGTVAVVAVPGALTDLRFALRGFRRTPAFTGAIVLTLGLGIGANTAIFSVVDAVLLRALPYAEPDELVAIWPGKLFSRRTMNDANADLTTFEGVAGWGGMVFTITEGGAPAELFGFEVTPNHFRLLGVQPALGRAFVESDGEPGAEPVAILSHALWMERFGGDPAVLGRAVALQSEQVARHTVIGVMGADYSPLRPGVEAWVPVVTDPAASGYSSSNFMEGYGRIASGAQIPAVRAELRAWTQRLREEDPGSVSQRDAEMATTQPLALELAGGLRFQLYALFGAAGLVLLIACVNVANLLLARTGSRTRELGVRAALGAGRTRIFRQLLTESLLLGLAGGAFGVLLAGLTRDGLLGILPGSGDAAVALDWRVIGFTLAIAIGASLLFGLVPAARAAGRGTATAATHSRGSGEERGSRRLQSGLMAVEVALALVAVFGAGLLTRAVRNLGDTDPGFTAEGVLTFRLTAPPAAYPDDPDVVRYFDSVREQVAAVPGVEAVGTISRIPLAGGRSQITIAPEGFDPGPDGGWPDATHRLVSPGYAEAMGFRLVEGRFLSEADARWGEQPHPGYVNRTLAERFWPDGAIGKSFFGPGGTPWLTVVGVIEDVHEDGLDNAPGAAVYVPHKDWAWRTMSLVIRTPLEPRSLVPAVEQAVWSVDSGIPVTRVRTLEEIVTLSISRVRTTGVLFGLFGGLALLLGCVGVYGVVAHTLGQRRKEFGVRVALGASTRQVIVRALRGAIVTVGLGLAAGVAFTPLVGSALAASLAGVPDRAPGVLVLSAAALAVVAMVASWLPARRATNVDPVSSLRAE